MPLNRTPIAPGPDESGGIFYGWVMVGAFFVFNMLGQASGTLNFGLFVIPISDELGMSRQMIGWAQTARMWAGGLSGIVIGRWLDRHGPRGPVLVAAVAAVGGLLILSRAQSPAVLFGVLLALGASGWTAPGGGALIATVPVSKWFVRLRGRATGIVQLGLGVGGALLLPLTQVLIDRHGWRSALVTLAWLSAAVVPLVVLLRRQPGDLGLAPDGGPPRRRAPRKDGAAVQVPRAAPPADDDPRWTMAGAARTTAMWQLTAAFASLAFMLGAASVHRVPHWVELGFSPATVSVAFGVDATVAMATALAGGFVVERLAARFVGAISGTLFCVALSLMLIGRAWPPVLFASVMLFGAAIGFNMVVQGVIWAQYFGWRFVGTIRGVVLPITVLAGGLGAPIAGALRDITGTYRLSWVIVLAMSALSTLLLLGARPPRSAERRVGG
ncbi:MAG: MFS transporter [Spirochaetaceae bacterium]|nr:MFS transporter [Spirochaetaceae bacterium]